jgi:hypothetical protein
MYSQNNAAAITIKMQLLSTVKNVESQYSPTIFLTYTQIPASRRPTITPRYKIAAQ